MPAPEPEGSDSSPDYAPVNVARPNWQCPHCRTKFGEDLAAATRCAEAGPAPDVDAGVPVLALQPFGALPTFGLTEVGPVQPVNADGVRGHRRDVVIAGRRLDPALLRDATEGADGLRILHENRTQEPTPTLHAPGLAPYNPLARLFLTGADRYGAYGRGTTTSVWIDEPRREETVWWRTPGPAERAALNMITGGLLDTLVEADEDKLRAQVRSWYGANNHTRVSMSVLLGPRAGLRIAHAHGAPNHIWALRWLTTHLDEVLTWHVRAVRSWAAGLPATPAPPTDALAADAVADQASGLVGETSPGSPDPVGALIPAPSHLRASEDLPRNPGKRRLALMEPFGADDYNSCRNVLVAALRGDPPANPVPDLGDVTTTVATGHVPNERN